jgi:trans-aconitate methyltransferase
MEHAEMVALIRPGVHAPEGVWADLGAGTGNFTYALRELLGPAATIYALDRDRRAVERLGGSLAGAGPGAQVVPLQADFLQPLRLPPLDGLLMANALHFVRDQAALLARLAAHLRPGGRILLVEYDLDAPRAYVPYPVAPARFAALCAEAGLGVPRVVGARRSPSSGISMFSAYVDVNQ